MLKGNPLLLLCVQVRVLHCENLSVEEQRDEFAEAQLVVAVHGAGLTNTIFCKPGTAVFEILLQHALTAPFFLHLANCLELRFFGYINRDGCMDHPVDVEVTKLIELMSTPEFTQWHLKALAKVAPDDLP